MTDWKDEVKKAANEGADLTFRFDPADIEANKWVCALSYLSILFFLPLVVCPNSKYGKFHANQALVLLIFSVAGSAVFGALKHVFLIGWLAGIAGALYSVLIVILMILGIVNVIQGKAKELPGIGKIRLIHE